MQILLDTNVIISGLLSGKGLPGRLLQAWLDGRFDLVTSHLQLDELRRTLGYEKLRDRINPAQVRDFVDNIVVMALIVPSVTAVAFSLDPDDNLILEPPSPDMPTWSYLATDNTCWSCWPMNLWSMLVRIALRYQMRLSPVKDFTRITCHRD